MGEAKRKKELQPQQPPPLPGDAEIVLLCADGFRSCSRSFCERIAKCEGEEAVKAEGRKDRGGMVASAVNLAFSIELYLKALRMMDGHSPSKHHRLDDLYAELPSRLRASIERAYNLAAEGKSGYPKSLGMSITHRDASPEEKARPPEFPTDESLGAVLQRSRTVFEAWRYLHEQGEPGKVKRLLYEFHYLGVVADVLREHARRL